MEKGAAAFIVVLVLAIAGIITYDMMQAQKTPAVASVADSASNTASQQPVIPATDPTVGPRLSQGTTPELVMREFSKATSAIARETEAEAFQRMYLPSGGWSGVVESVIQTGTSSAPSYVIRFSHASSEAPGGVFFIEAPLAQLPPGLAKGDRVTYDGRIAKLELIASAINESYRILLDDVRVLQVLK